MLENQATLDRLQRIRLEGGLLPEVTLLGDLIKLLNRTRTTQGKRVVRILEKMLEIEVMTKPLTGMLWPAMSLKKTDLKKFQLLVEIDQKTALLNQELASYRFRPHAVVGVGGGGGPSEWVAWWKGDSREKRDPQLRMLPSEALELILKLTQIRYLTRLRRCMFCNKWLYAKFQHQIFCSTTCQQKHFTQRPAWKAHRRAYMRDRYHRFVKNPLRMRKPK